MADRLVGHGAGEGFPDTENASSRHWRAIRSSLSGSSVRRIAATAGSHRARRVTFRESGGEATIE
jgi:hypothetical protein